MSEVKEATITRQRGLGRRIFWSIILIGSVLLLARFVIGGLSDHGFRRSLHRAHTGAFADPLGEGAKWALDEVGATDAQRNEIRNILDTLGPSMAEYQGKSRTLRSRLSKALEAEQIDPHELAEIKTAALGLAERAMSEGLDLTLGISEVLTPEQRRKLVHTWQTH